MTIGKEEILSRVGQILHREFEIPLEQIRPEAHLYEDLGLDSLDSVDLVVALEKEFAFKVVREADEPKIQAIRTVEDIFGFIDQKQQGK